MTSASVRGDRGDLRHGAGIGLHGLPPTIPEMPASLVLTGLIVYWGPPGWMLLGVAPSRGKGFERGSRQACR
ncbi:hypothetical protein ACSNOJ_06275 [Streptomyces sp. URMC 128]|uniref:hypothetical protein n=1 Tax=Streptomyces sp. URMC 128 TaxID=3423404 RepID=UPI003F1DE46E